jgi:hypothetical protein
VTASRNKPSGTLSHASAKRLVLGCFALLCVAALAGLFPKFLRQVPGELEGEYFLLLKMNPDKTKEVFTNIPPFATFFSNRVALAAGEIRPVARVMRVAQKGTNVYVFSFEDRSSWMITQAGVPDRLVVLESSKTNSKSATMFVISRIQTNQFPISMPSVR